MNSEQSHPVTRQEALSALEEIDRVRDHMRRTLAAGAMAPMLILWGIIWTIGFAGEQFMPQAYRLWLVLDLVGVAATFYLGSRPQGSAIKAPGGLRVFASWAVLFAFAALCHSYSIRPKCCMVRMWGPMARRWSEKWPCFG